MTSSIIGFYDLSFECLERYLHNTKLVGEELKDLGLCRVKLVLRQLLLLKLCWWIYYESNYRRNEDMIE